MLAVVGRHHAAAAVEEFLHSAEAPFVEDHADAGCLGGDLLDRWSTVGQRPRNLNIAPDVYPKNLFIDRRLKPGDVFSADRVRTVQDGALAVLLSQNYIDSYMVRQGVRSLAGVPRRRVTCQTHPGHGAGW